MTKFIIIETAAKRAWDVQNVGQADNLQEAIDSLFVNKDRIAGEDRTWTYHPNEFRMVIFNKTGTVIETFLTIIQVD